MQHLSKNYEHLNTEEKWYKHWLQNKYFESKPNDKLPYSIVIPPPNVTGVLHMGHCLNSTIQDILIRRHKQLGFNTCWVPGTDHASIATEAKVVAMLKEKGIDKNKLSRQEFLNYAFEWKEKYGGIILQQLKKLGCSLDWTRTSFTMDEDYYKSVIDVFIQLKKEGKIYRGNRMIHWDVIAQTALSDEEVIYKQVEGKLYHINYKIDGTENEFITIATVRPETILGDTAICVHPNDERFKHLHNKCAIIPLIHKKIPIIVDEYVEMDFGTGALKVTPAHDLNDFNLGKKHNLETVDIMNNDGTLSPAAQLYMGLDRMEVRKLIVADLNEHIVKIENYTHQVGFSERTNAIVEPRISLQWWLNMKALAAPALEVVMNDTIRFHPAKFKNTYRHWMENIKDWCISRQLWWGQRIPVWYDDQKNEYLAHSLEAIHQQFPETIHKILIQDEDCLDTWFSSWLWPFEVFKGLSKPNNPDIQYYYPTNTLVTAPEIIFFWVARMIMAGQAFMQKIPFKDVYFTGIVRDKQGRKMSKSLGNSPDLLKIIDDYGADAVRFGIMIASPAGNDLLFDESAIQQGKMFNNKLWNVLKLIKILEEKIDPNFIEENNVFAHSWMEEKIKECTISINKMYNDFKLSDALKTIYSLIWDDFCSWYMEWIKPALEQKISLDTYNKIILYFENILQILHPFMPFITEEIFHLLKKQPTDICIKQIEKNTAEINQKINFNYEQLNEFMKI
ncbi:MAG: valine--tRNA ligase, partial [Sediminibacterium sp.]|nr:valine--tRNA ligase [Sediminibacterium sp.]